MSINSPNVKRLYCLPADSSVFIFGPRGTGKSTWLRKNLGDAYYIDLLDNEQFIAHSKDPALLKKLVDANLSKYQYYVIDEIQKIPELLDTVHLLISKYPKIKFILTGSSARKLRRAGTNLLAGRALLSNFYPFIAAELQDKFDIDKALTTGLVPLVYSSSNPSDTLHAYLALYLKEEVKDEGITRNIGSFAKFLETISFSHGSTLNLSNIARDSQLSRKIVEEYLSILHDLLLSYEIPVFAKRSKRETISKTKFYLFDAGVYYALRPKGPLDRSEEVYGASLEGLVLQHLKAWIDYSNNQHSVYFWQTRGGAEVDFIVYGEQYFLAIEIKHHNRVQNKDLRHLKTFCQDYPEAKPLLLYMGQDRVMVNNVLCIPVKEFLMLLDPRQELNLT